MLFCYWSRSIIADFGSLYPVVISTEAFVCFGNLIGVIIVVRVLIDLPGKVAVWFFPEHSDICLFILSFQPFTAVFSIDFFKPG